MTVHQVSGTVNLNAGSAMIEPTALDVSVYVKLATSDNYNEVGRAQLIGTPVSGEVDGVNVDPDAIPVLLRSIADAYEQALNTVPVDPDGPPPAEPQSMGGTVSVESATEES